MNNPTSGTVSELLPCYCGKKPRFSDEPAAHVACRCGLELWGAKAHFSSREEAVQAWNSRFKPATQVVDEKSERAEFEAWAVEENKWLVDRDSFGNYIYGYVRDAWNTWSKRAALAAPVQSEQEPEAWAIDVEGYKTVIVDNYQRALSEQEHFQGRGRTAVIRALSAAPVRAVRMPERHEDRCDSSEAEAYQNGWNDCLDAVARLNGEQPTPDPAASLAKVADGSIPHVFNGMCPDAVEGHDSRDPDCPACQALILFSGQQ